MIVYIEYVIIDNMVIDYILLYILFKCLKMNVRWWRLSLAAALGTAVAVVLPVVNLPSGLYFFIKVITGITMVYVSREFSSFKEFIKSAILFFLFTFLLGGVLIGLFNMLKIDYSLTTNFNYIADIPIGIVIFSAFLMAVILKFTFEKIYRKRNLSAFIYDCNLSFNNTLVNVKGFLDSGNQLYDSASGCPVIITGRNTASKLFKDGLFEGKTRARFLEFSTIGGKNKMLIFKIDKLEIYIGNNLNIINNITLGISPFHIRGNEDYDLILHPAILKEIKNV